MVVVVEDEIGMEVGEWMVVSGRSPPTEEEEGGGCCWWEEGGRDPNKRKEGYVFCVRIEKRK